MYPSSMIIQACIYISYYSNKVIGDAYKVVEACTTMVATTLFTFSIGCDMVVTWLCTLSRI